MYAHITNFKLNIRRGAPMRKIHLNLLYLASFLSFTIMTIPDAEAITNIPNGSTVTAPPQPNDAINFQPPAPGGTFIIESGTTFDGALTTTNPGTPTGSLVLNNGSQLNGAVGNNTNPLLQITLNSNATIVGATSAQTFNLGLNTLTNTGALNLPAGLVINTKLVSNALFGNINIGAATDSIAAGVTINVDASAGPILTPGQPLFIVSAGAGTSNAPITVTSNSVLYTFTGLNLNGNLEIFPTFIPPANVVTNPAASTVGTVLPGLIAIAAANPGSDLATVVSALLSLPTAATLTDALLQIAPASGLIGVSRESFNTTKQFQRLWLEHLRYNRCLRHVAACCSPRETACCNPCQDVCEDLTIWADGFGYYGHQDNKDHFNGYQDNTWGTMLAFEMPLFCGWRVGLGGGYAYSNLDEKKFDNHTDIHNYQGTLYFSYDTTPWFVDGGFSFGWNRYDGTRHIVFTGIDRTAHAEYDGKEYTGFLATGYQYYCNGFEITPLVSILYSHLQLDDYTEKGANSLDLHINKQNYNYLESGLGIKLAYLFQTSCGLYIPELHTRWLHDFYDRGLDLTSSFTGIGTAAGNFRNKGPRIDPNTWNIGGSITCMASDNFSIMAVYDYERSRTYYDHQGLLELSYDF